MTMVQISRRVLPISQRPSSQRELPDNTLLNSCSKTCGRILGEISLVEFRQRRGEFFFNDTSSYTQVTFSLPQHPSLPPYIAAGSTTKIYNHNTLRMLAFPNSARQYVVQLTVYLEIVKTLTAITITNTYRNEVCARKIFLEQ